MRDHSEQMKEIYDFVDGYRRSHKYSPSYREIMEHVGIRSTITVQSRLRAMERLGMIRNDGKPRTIVTLPGESWHEGA